MRDSSFEDLCVSSGDRTISLYSTIVYCEMLWGTQYPKTIGNTLLAYLVRASLVLSCVLSPVAIELVITHNVSLVSLVTAVYLALIIIAIKYAYGLLVGPLKVLRREVEQLGVYGDYCCTWEPRGLYLTHRKGASELISKCAGMFPMVKHLSLSGTDTTDAVVSSLLEFRGMRALDLSDTLITDSVVAILMQSEKLECLDVSGTGVTDGALKQMEEMASLRLVCVDRTSVTDEGISALKRKRPLIQVVS